MRFKKRGNTIPRLVYILYFKTDPANRVCFCGTTISNLSLGIGVDLPEYRYDELQSADEGLLQTDPAPTVPGVPPEYPMISPRVTN